MPHCEPDVAIIHHCSNALQNWRIWCRTPSCQRTPGPARGCRLLARSCSLDKPCSAAISGASLPAPLDVSFRIDLSQPARPPRGRLGTSPPTVLRPGL